MQEYENASPRRAVSHRHRNGGPCGNRHDFGEGEAAGGRKPGPRWAIGRSAACKTREEAPRKTAKITRGPDTSGNTQTHAARSRVAPEPTTDAASAPDSTCSSSPASPAAASAGAQGRRTATRAAAACAATAAWSLSLPRLAKWAVVD